MKKVLILGAAGMVGHAVYQYFLQKQYDVTATYHTAGILQDGTAIFFDATQGLFNQLPTGFDYAINCIGLIKPYVNGRTKEAIELNAWFPWQLAAWARKHKTRLIHITTDCAFSGSRGHYTESDPTDATDVYGKTKALGECTDDAMVLRVSVVGEELHRFGNLLSWAKSQEGRQISGYTTHLWNGMTTWEYAKCCHLIIDQQMFQPGLFHLFAKDVVSKYQLLQLINERFGLRVEILRAEPVSVDRTLQTEKGLCAAMQIPTVERMIEMLTTDSARI